MLDTHAHGKGLALHPESLFIQGFNGVTGRMADGQDDLTAGKKALAAGSTDAQTGNSPVPKRECRHTGGEANLTAERENLAADALNDIYEDVGTDMRFGIPENGFGRTVTVKLFEDPLNTGIMGARVQFPIGKGSGSAFAELDITLGIQRTSGAETLDGCPPGERIHAALQDDRPQAGTGKHQRGKHACRAEADNNRTLVGGKMRNLIKRRTVRRNIRIFLLQEPVLIA